MPDFGAWLNAKHDREYNAQSRAASAWNRILDRPTEITINRNGTDLPVQTVRLEVPPTPREIGVGGEPQLGLLGKKTVILFGIKDHPYLDDTDVQRNDRFVWQDESYDVTGVVEFPGEIQATGEIST